jgi:hypothetical protein
MAVATVNIPAASLNAPTKRGNSEALKKQMITGLDKYGKFFKTASENSKLPVELLIAFAATESGVGGDIGSTSSPTYGIMQWNREFAKSQLESEYKLGRMTPEEKSILAKYNIKFDANGKTRAITASDQGKPELNILIGSILLGMLSDSYLGGRKDSKIWGIDETGQLRVDRIVSVWNAGPYGDTGKKARFGNHANAAALANVVNTTTREYIGFISGKNGYYDILLQPEMQKYLSSKALK